MIGKPNTRGGKRPNAGRKKGGTGRKAITVQVSLIPPLVKAIDEVRGNQTRAAWIRSRLRCAYLQFSTTTNRDTNNMNELIEKIKQWGEVRGITGPNGKGTLLGQLSKSQEELTETRDAAVKYQQHEPQSMEGIDAWFDIKDGIGDTFVTLVLAAEMAGLDFQGCVQAAYDEIKGRRGEMVNGVFVKNAQAMASADAKTPPKETTL